MSRINSRESGNGGEEVLVECGRCEQLISWDSLGHDRKKNEKDEFYVQGLCRRGEVGERS